MKVLKEDGVTYYAVNDSTVNATWIELGTVRVVLDPGERRDVSAHVHNGVLCFFGLNARLTAEKRADLDAGTKGQAG